MTVLELKLQPRRGDYRRRPTGARGEFCYDVDRGDMVFNGMLERVKELESFEYTVGLSKGVSTQVIVEIAVDSSPVRFRPGGYYLTL